MLLAALSALEMVQSLTSKSSSSQATTGFGQAAASPFDPSGAAAASTTPGQPSGAGGSSPLSPATMSALLAAQSQSSTAATPAPTDPNAALNDLFSQLDADHDGTITKQEFENALGAGGTNLAQADRVFDKLDKSGNGISIDDLSSALKGKGHHHHSHAASSTDSSGASTDPLLQALSGASGNSVTNSDGSTTTSITYADGSKVTMTSPAAKASSSSATSPYNFLEQMIAREAQAMSSAASQSLSISV
ncbi:MAG: EF-hand domain-containing protein [Bradyrhizobium sp.]